MLHLPISKLIFFLIFICLSLFQTPIEAQDNYVITICNDTSNDANYASNSPFETNLNGLFRALIANTPSTGFNTTTFGKDTDLVYGLALCRGDISNEDCRSCVKTATEVIIRNCPNRKNATLVYDTCLIRYSDEPIISKFVTIEWGYVWIGINTSDPSNFKDKLDILMGRLASSAPLEDSRFVTGTEPFELTHIYGLVQCTRDLPEDDCKSCLEFVLNNIPTCCPKNGGAQVASLSCFIRYQLSPFFNDTTPPPKEGNGLSRAVVIGLSILVPIVLILIVLGCYLRRGTRKPSGNMVTGQELQRLDISLIRRATNNFSEANKLGEGGFGVVYKGTFNDETEVAVKKLISIKRRIKDFESEVQALGRVQHRNVLKLHSYCLHREEKYLVYEYMPNKSLDDFLFDETGRAQLDMGNRLNIIHGIAKGLRYLHEESRITVIHRDLKAANILLDSRMNPKIADFGTAKIFGENQIKVVTNERPGTRGYMPPEYIFRGEYSKKTDVFSFGVLLLEIISGEQNGSSHNLLAKAWKLWRTNKPIDFIDPLLFKSCSTDDDDAARRDIENKSLRCIHVGLLSVQENSEDRSSMEDVLHFLEGDFAINIEPNQPPITYATKYRTESSYSPTTATSSSSTYETNSEGVETLALVSSEGYDVKVNKSREV